MTSRCRVDAPAARRGTSWPFTTGGALRSFRANGTIAATALLAGCQGTQSALAPGGRVAGAIAELSLVLFVAAALIFVFVMALTWRVATSKAGNVDKRLWVIGGGIVFPIVMLSALLVYTTLLSGRLTAPAQPNTLLIEVTAKQWWWEVRYLGRTTPAVDDLPIVENGFFCLAPRGVLDTSTSDATIVLANEIRLPVGEPVRIALKSADVIHSFWVPALAGKVDMVPGRTNVATLRADRHGVYRGQCAEYCGGPHALMALFVIAEPAPAFATWLAMQARAAIEPANGDLRTGRDAFLANGCGACHTIRGTPAAGRLGPDLTHIGSRRSLGAATLTNHAGTLAGWVADVQGIKPGAKMPSFDQIDGRDLRLLAMYLESLE